MIINLSDNNSSCHKRRKPDSHCHQFGEINAENQQLLKELSLKDGMRQEQQQHVILFYTLPILQHIICIWRRLEKARVFMQHSCSEPSRLNTSKSEEYLPRGLLIFITRAQWWNKNAYLSSLKKRHQLAMPKCHVFRLPLMLQHSHDHRQDPRLQSRATSQFLQIANISNFCQQKKALGTNTWHAIRKKLKRRKKARARGKFVITKIR